MRINAAVKMALAAAPLLLGGCATFHQAHQSIHLASDAARSNIARMQKTAPLPVVQTVSTPYLMGDMVRVDHSDTLPAVFRKTVNLSVAKPLTIGQFATQISMMSRQSHELGIVILSTKPLPPVLTETLPLTLQDAYEIQPGRWVTIAPPVDGLDLSEIEAQLQALLPDHGITIQKDAA